MATETTTSDLNQHTDASRVPPKTSRRQEGDEVSFFELFIVVIRRRRLILSMGGLFAILGLILAFLLPERFTATVTLLPPQQNSSMSSVLASQLGNLGGMAALAGGSLGLKNPNELYVSMLKSRTVEDSMVQRFELMHEYRERYQSDARKALEKHTTIDGTAKDGLIRLSVVDRDPRRAAQLANGYVDQFRFLSEHLAITEAGQRRVFFEKQLEQAKNDLATAEDALKQTEQQTGLIQLDSQARALIESAAQLRAQIAAKEVQIDSLSTFATSENSQLLQAQQELQGLRAQLAKLGGSENGIDAGLIVPKGRVPESGLEYIRKLREVKYRETIFEILARQFELAKLDEAKQGALIQVVDMAVPPDRHSFPRRSLVVLGTTAAGLVIAILIALIQTELQRFNSTPEGALRLHRLREAFGVKERTRSAGARLSQDSSAKPYE